MTLPATDSTPPAMRWCVRAGGRWVPALRIEDSTLVGGAIHLDLPARVAEDAVDPTGLVCVRLARNGPPMCGQLLQTLGENDELRTLVLSPLGFLERAEDVGDDGDDYLLPPDASPIALGACHRLRSTCKDGNHLRLELSTRDWLRHLLPRFDVVAVCDCDRSRDAISTPSESPGICRRIKACDATPFELVRLRAGERITLSIDLVSVMPTRTVLVGHERERASLTSSNRCHPEGA